MAFLEIIGANIIHAWDVPALAVLGCVRFLDAAVLVLITTRYEGDISHIGLALDRIPGGIRRGVLWSLAFGLFTGFCILILYGVGTSPLQYIKAPLPKSMSVTFLYFLTGGIISPAAEELFFRGIVFLFFRRWGFPTALIISTTFFTLLHPLSSGIPLPQILGGLLFATAFEIEKNLLVPGIIHISGNLAIFTLSYLTF